eukprot:TRINITY_DN8290_c0_g4_i1.p1 TRINITY_DN8290_c0_g4~~TRINITY_DN8290_c0_g4_i1.p1  ORF type:complete len:538 (-),score=73.75 TRINITY_DN8290_c0_g4_i1:888-2501(-)
MTICSGVTFTKLGTSRLQPAYHGSTSGLQPVKYHKSAFQLAPLGTIVCQSARRVAEVVGQSKARAPKEVVIQSGKRGGEPSNNNEHQGRISGVTEVSREIGLLFPVHVVIQDGEREEESIKDHELHGRIRSTLGIPSSMQWTARAPPTSPLDLLRRLTTSELWNLVSDPQRVTQTSYAAGRMVFFTGALVFAFGSTDRPIPKSDMTAMEYSLHYIENQLPPLWLSLLEVHRLDAANVGRGYYLAPYDMDPRHRQWDPAFVLSQLDMLTDFLEGFVNTRRIQGRQEVLRTSAEAKHRRDRYPDYYLQNFHFQKDGWLSETSAKSYDVASEAIFSGAQDAMQRQGLVPLHFFMKNRRQQNTRLLELACGTGRYLTFIKDNYPLLNTVAVDLSPFYVAEARRNMDYFKDFKQRISGNWMSAPSEFVEASAESLPFPSQSFDVVSCVYLFHELPPRARRNVVAEMYRVLKPGGIVIFQDSRQKVDYPDPDIKLSAFPANYHEPYYMSYINTNLPELFGTHGFHLESCSFVHSAKVMTFVKP